jgi:hypothetical protein
LSFIDIELDIDLADALAMQTQLTKLVLWNVDLGDGAASRLAVALHEMAMLQEVRIYLREVSKDDVKCVLAAVGELPQLQTMTLGGRAVADCMRVVTEAAVEQGRLRELDLTDCPIGDDGAAHLAAMLERSRSLSVLGVYRCEIGDAGLERLGRDLTRNTTLRTLDVRYNDFTAEGVACFANMMGDMHGLQKLTMDRKWEQQLLPGIERNYSLLELPGFSSAAQPFLQRNARGYAKARAATLAWLCICRYRRPYGLLPELGLIIARLIYASGGHGCWADDDDAKDDAKRARRTE